MFLKSFATCMCLPLNSSSQHLACLSFFSFSSFDKQIFFCSCSIFLLIHSLLRGRKSSIDQYSLAPDYNLKVNEGNMVEEVLPSSGRVDVQKNDHSGTGCIHTSILWGGSNSITVQIHLVASQGSELRRFFFAFCLLSKTH